MTVPIHLPSLPAGIERDNTVQGRIYYTRAQMTAYGHACATAVLLGQTKPYQQDNTTVEDLRKMFGISA